MKKLLVWMILGVASVVLTACEENRKPVAAEPSYQTDSLKQVIEQKDDEINDMMGTLNEIQEGLKVISEAEDRVTLLKDGEGANKSEQIKESVTFIANKMKENRALIAKLQKQLSASTVKGDQLKKTLDGMVRQLDEKEKQLQQLREELDAKEIHISALDEQVNNLNTDVTNLKTESAQKTETIQAQDKQLNTAWFVFGTKKELKEQNIIVDGKVLQNNFNKNYFTKIDIRQQKEIKLYSKSASLLTVHPSDSYTLSRDASKQYVLKINNPQLFWSTSKYLVVLVK